MSTSFLPFPSRFFSRKSRSKRSKTAPPELKPAAPLPVQPLRTAPAQHSQHTSSRHTSSVRSAPTAEYAPQRYPDVYMPRKIPSLNELSRNAPSPQPRPQGRHAFKEAERYAPRHSAPQHARERDDVWRGRRFSEQAPFTQSMPLSRSTSVGGHAHSLEPPWQGGLAVSIEEESDSEGETEGPLGPIEVLEAFFNEEPMPECIVLPSPTSPKGLGHGGQLPPPNGLGQAGHFSPPNGIGNPTSLSPPTQAASVLPPPPPPPSSPPPPPPGVRPRSRTPQLLNERLPPVTPPRRPSPSGVEPSKSAPVASPPQNPTKSSFSLPRLRRNSSRARRNEPSEPPPSSPRDEELTYLQRPLPPTPPERGDSFRNRLLRSRRYSGEGAQPDAIQEEEVEPPLRQLGEALSLSPAPRPMSLVAYIIPPEERAQIGHRRRGSMSSVSSTGDSTYSHPNPPPIHHQNSHAQAQPQPMPISPFRLTFNPPTGLNPPPRPRSSMVSTRSAASSNAHWSSPQSVPTSSILRASPVLQDVIPHW